MIIKSLDIISFGKFQNKIIDFAHGLNIIVGDNESGKSTILNFIYAMLYGFGDNRGKNASLREKFTPWSGGVCEGKLHILTNNNENITIYRKAGSVKKNDILKIYNSDTGTECSCSPEALAGINSDTFTKTLCIKQLSTTFTGPNDEIVQRLSNISDGGDENISFEKAIKILENARREIQPLRGSGGSLGQVNSEIAEFERDNSLKKSLVFQLEDTLSLLPKASSLLDDAQEKLSEAMKEDFVSPIAHLRGRIEEKENALRSNSQSKSSFSKRILVYLGGVFLFLSLSFFAFLPAFSLIFIIISISSFLSSFAFKKEEYGKSQESELSRLSEELSTLLKNKANHDEKLSLLKQNKEECEKNLSELKTKKDLLSAQISSFKSKDITFLYQKKEKLEKKLSAITAAIDSLTIAHEEMQRNFTPLLNKKASEYFKSITSEKYTRIFSDEQFNLTIDMDIPRKSELFSGGTKDQLYLSLRLALSDMLFGDESTFLLLDQPFLQYDSIRTKKTVELLKSLSHKRQIIIFTSDKNKISFNKHIQMLT